MWFEKSRTSGGVVFELFACATKGRRPKAACRFSAKQPLGVMPYSTPHLLTTPYRVNFLISVTLIQISTHRSAIGYAKHMRNATPTPGSTPARHTNRTRGFAPLQAL